jgi:2',3'-cyclic-nucleotide 2'-phosphodiesterase (5'-nucleotidase family)
VDGGNFGDPYDNSENWDGELWEKTTFTWDMMSKLKYDVVTPGDLEMIQGLDAMKALFAKHPGIQVVSANIEDKSGKLVYPKYAILNRGGVKIGVTAVTGKQWYEYNLKKGRQKKDDFIVLESKDALRDAVAELRPKADVVVALIHESLTDVKTQILTEVPGIDVVVVGHNPNYMFNPDRVGSTLLLLSGPKGQYLPVLTLTLDDSKKKILDYNGEGKPLDDAIAKDAEYDKVVTSWETDYKKKQDASRREKAAHDAVLQGTEKYVGAEICGRCHADEYSKWAKTPHAHAYQTLVKEEMQNSEDCLKCHTVGYGEQTGYTLTNLNDPEGKSVSTKDTPQFRNVQCESCHGMGTFHGTTMMVTKTAEETCRNCHSLAKGLIH